MGYSKNPATIERVEPFLELMYNSDSALEWETPDPQKLAYYLREGISAAAAALAKDPTNEKMQQFVSIRAKYVIKIKGNKVVAELRNALPMAVAQVKKLKTVYLPDIGTLSEIIGAIAKYIVEENKEQIKIPNFDLTETELEQLGLYLDTKSLDYIITDDVLVIGEEGNVSN